MAALPKVSDRNSFRANQDYSDSYRYLYPNQSEKRFVSCMIKNGQKSIRLNPRHQSELIGGRNDLDLFWSKIRIGSIQDRIDLDWKLDSDSFGLMSQIKPGWFLIPRQLELFRFIQVSVSEPKQIIPN